MCRRATVRAVSMAGWAASLAFLPMMVFAQAGTVGWRHIGNSAMELPLPSLATGAVGRVWYSPDGSSLYAKTAAGRVFQTADFEQWRLVTDQKVIPPTEEQPQVASAPETGLKLTSGPSGRIYGLGQDVYRSDNGGESWINLTAF